MRRPLRILVVIIGGIFFTTAGVGALVLASAGIFSAAPALPSFAVPPNAVRLGSETHRCDRTADFGRDDVRTTLFGSHDTWEEIRSALDAEFGARGWTPGQFAGPRTVAYFSPGNGRSVLYDAAGSLQDLRLVSDHPLPIEDSQQTYDLYIVVSVVECGSS